METVQNILDRKSKDPVTVHPDETVLAALESMSEHDIGSVLVVEHDQLAGILTERDYARKLVLAGKASGSTPIREVMSGNPVCVSPERKVNECMSIMSQRHFRHLPVLDGDRLIGVVSIGDLVNSTIADQEHTIEELTRYISG